MAGRSLSYEHTAVLLFLLLMAYLQGASAIGCFVCSSVNGSEPDCEDTFNNTGRFYVPDCMAGRKDRSGKFPATECVKMKAELVSGGYPVLIRACVVDSGGTNSETEIGRSNHCGLVDHILYDDVEMQGCIVSCNTDGCNGSRRSFPTYHVTTVSIMAAVYARFML